MYCVLPLITHKCPSLRTAEKQGVKGRPSHQLLPSPLLRPLSLCLCPLRRLPRGRCRQRHHYPTASLLWRHQRELAEVLLLRLQGQSERRRCNGTTGRSSPFLILSLPEWQRRYRRLEIIWTNPNPGALKKKRNIDDQSEKINIAQWSTNYCTTNAKILNNALFCMYRFLSIL